MKELDFLEEVRILLREYNMERRNSAADFNIFEMMEIEYKEVAMCRILHELLRVDGKHGRKTLFLKVFVEDVLRLQMDEEELKSAVVQREYVIKGDRRIDIVIETSKRFIPIEVKIYAEEQRNQCLDYFIFAKQKNEQKPNAMEWHTYYLTLYGNAPSAFSTMNHPECLSNVQCISWDKDVAGWLSALLCLDEVKSLPNICEVLKQYRQSVYKICGRMEKQLEKKVCTMIIKDAERMKAAREIYRSYLLSCTMFMKQFMADVEQSLDELIEIKNLPVHKKSFFETEKQINGYYSANRSTYPGLDYSIAAIGDYELAIRVEIDHKLFIGIVLAKISRNENGEITYSSYEKIPDEIVDLAKSKLTLPDFNTENWWLWWRYIPDMETDAMVTKSPDFKMMNEEYYNLFDDEYRRGIIRQICTTFEMLCQNIKNQDREAGKDNE